MQTAIPKIGFVRLKTILEHIPISSSSWWAGVATGRYPQPLKLGEFTTVWRAEDIRELIKDPSRNNWPSYDGRCIEMSECAQS